MKNQKNSVYMYLIGLDSLFDRETEMPNTRLYISMLAFDCNILFISSVFNFLFDRHSEQNIKHLNINKFLFDSNSEIINYG
jgi:hypothetical protein